MQNFPRLILGQNETLTCFDQYENVENNHYQKIKRHALHFKKTSMTVALMKQDHK